MRNPHEIYISEYFNATSNVIISVNMPFIGMRGFLAEKRFDINF